MKDRGCRRGHLHGGGMRHSPSLRVLLSTLPAMALAAALPSRAATQRRLQVVTYDIVPYGMLDEQGQLGGEFVDITNRLAVQTGIAFDNRLLPYPRAVATIEHGQPDHQVGLPMLDRRHGTWIWAIRPGGRVG